METIKIIELIFKIIIGITGWLSLFHLIHSNKPKVTGDILMCMRGEIKYIEESLNKPYTSYTLYPILTNQGKKTTTIFDYELEIDFGDGYIRVEKFYGLDNIKDFSFAGLNVPDFINQLIYNKEKSIKQGHALHGFLMFGIEDLSYVTKKTYRYKLICIDAFQKRHIIEKYSDQINQHQIFLNLSGAKFVKVS